MATILKISNILDRFNSTSYPKRSLQIITEKIFFVASDAIGDDTA